MPTKAHATDAKISFFKNSENGRWKFVTFLHNAVKGTSFSRKKLFIPPNETLSKRSETILTPHASPPISSRRKPRSPHTDASHSRRRCVRQVGETP